MTFGSRKIYFLVSLCIASFVPAYAQQAGAAAADPKPTASVSITDNDVELRRPEIADAANKIAKTDANKVAKTVRTFAVKSDTWLVPNDLILQAIQNNKEFPGLDLVLVNDWQLAQVRTVFATLLASVFAILLAASAISGRLSSTSLSVVVTVAVGFASAGVAAFC